MSATEEKQATAGTVETLGTEEMSTTAGPQQHQNSMNCKTERPPTTIKGHQQW
jgi:hypothetical protein